MKGKRIISLLPRLALGFGCLGGVLWALMNALCRDDKGLLLPGNLPGILLAVLSAVCCLGTVWLSRWMTGSNRYNENFPASRRSGAACFALAAGILWTLLTVPDQRQDVLSSAHRLLGFLSVVSIALVGMGRWQGKRPNFLLCGIVCLFFCIHMAERYRLWSSDPQTADYLCQILACVGLALTAYHRTAFTVGMGNRKQHLAISLATTYFSMTCLFTKGMGIFYLTGSLWAAAELSPLSHRAAPLITDEGGESL